MTNNPTEKALIARGFDSAKASELRRAGMTLEKLKMADWHRLTSLGLTAVQIEAVYKEKRPAIPLHQLTKVLFANRWVCCVCRDPERPIIVHHIKEWSCSRDHAAKNLAVLCTIHHGEAHARRELEQNLTSERITQCKVKWEREVKRKDTLAMLLGTQLNCDNWLYFNHLRLFELAQELGVSLTTLATYQEAVVAGVCDKAGAIVKTAAAGSYMYADSDRIRLYSYAVELFLAVMKGAGFRNISDFLDRGILGHGVVEGDLVFVQGLHTFSPLIASPANTQLTTGKREANKVTLNFVFDLAEATSGSSWSLWLRGQQVVCSLIQVKRVGREAGRVVIYGTVLSIRNELDGLKKRTYEHRLYEAEIPQRKQQAALGE